MSRHNLVRLAVVGALATGTWVTGLSGAEQLKTEKNNDRVITVTDAAGRKHTRVKPITLAERRAAAARLKEKRDAAVAKAKAALNAAQASGDPAAVAAAAAVMAAVGPVTFESAQLMVDANGQLIPDYSGLTPNYANSPAPAFQTEPQIDPNTGLPVLDPITGLPVLVPVIDPATGLPVAVQGTGMRKFVDGLPGLHAAGANNLGQFIPVAVADTTTHPGAEYYEIALVEYREQMHSDLPPVAGGKTNPAATGGTKLRGYVQAADCTAALQADPHYLGPLIIAQRNIPVRIKFTNCLPSGAGGNLFLPVDTSIMGAGPGPNAPLANPDITCMKDATGVVPRNCFSENRATIHLHGGVTPWISDGTTHQWITPATEDTAYPKGVSVFNVPDMPNPGAPPKDPGAMYGSNATDLSAGVQTFYYTNDQSARLMFYHDHAMGITRLNVYAGEAAGYLLQDAVEQDLVARNIIPDVQIPLIFQDKTFVDPATIRVQDPTWNWGSGTTFTDYVDPNFRTTTLRDPVKGDLWWPHVYMPAQNPYDLSGLNAMGRWHYGPWFWPPVVIPYGPVPNPYYDCNAFGLPDATHPCSRPWQPMENPGAPNPSWGAEAFLDTPVINGTAYPTLTVEPKAYRFRVLDAAHDRFINLQWYVAADKTSATAVDVIGTIDPSTLQPRATRLCDGSVTDTDPANPKCTEVRMVPASAATQGLAPWASNWPADARVGGVPDPLTKGPDWIQIGTEGGFLPMPVVVPNQPITWNANPTTFNFGNVADHSLLLGPAERADVIVDFSAYAGKTLILYNDAPAAFPALDPRNDYYTGSPDLTGEGGVAPVLPGYGPNIRTIMRVVVAGTPAAPYDVAALMAEWAPKTVVDPTDPTQTFQAPGVFQRGQDPIIVGQTAYNEAYGMTFPTFFPNWGVARIQDTSMRFQTTTGAFTGLNLEPKAIHDEMGATFDDYGRMSAKLGIELPRSTALAQMFVMQGYADPATELVKISAQATPIGDPAADGTQLWKITHNGVDTHPVHFHLFHVQLINRVGWDGAIRLPHPTELGWKDTLRISPLEDTIVALRPIAPDPALLPWALPNSIRPLNPVVPLGVSAGFTNLDPLGNAVTIFNDWANFGWEYVWHCHILSHEENDMMRSVVFAVPPAANLTLTAVVAGNNNQRSTVLTWTDAVPAVANKTGYTIQRANDPNFTTGLVEIPVGLVNTYSDRIGRLTTPFFYRVAASNTVGSTVVGFPTMTANSGWSNVAAVNPLLAPGPLTAILFSPGQIRLTFFDNANNETGFIVERSTGLGTGFVPIATLPARAATGNVVYTDTTAVAGVVNTYRVKAVSGIVESAYSPAAAVLMPAPPAGPLGFTASAVGAGGGRATVTLSWVDNSADETGFSIQRATNAAFTTGLVTVNLVANTTSRVETVASGTYYYRIRSFNQGGYSTYVVATPFPIVTP